MASISIMLLGYMPIRRKKGRCLQHHMPALLFYLRLGTTACPRQFAMLVLLMLDHTNDKYVVIY
ncbi:hypothetical protein PR001_g17155 [Phytophthora rubi]|uniref:Uncharacterized protein n=1 Tax=Phytophthora rubi TaxID=129364 RepID=A0A6A3KGZ7_9STRA|nr:hypothetical protein PR001_g17155 [Phytophthora rubi]